MKNDNPDFLFHESIREIAPGLAELIDREEYRQVNKLIMIPSESRASEAVREALGSVFQNIYAEGYPRRRTVHSSLELIRNTEFQLASYLRYGDRRFYKGTEYVNLVESMAGRLACALFANDAAPEAAIRANVQALSGSAANLAVYDALLSDGDLIMGMDLFQGGHLTHGSEFNQSGKRYNVVSYGVNPKTEQLDYEEIRRLADLHKPKLIVAGFTSYPWAPDWQAFREIAESAGAFLMADISHTAGLVLGGVYPNPLGTADVTVFTTHKTLTGPRGAVILSTDREIADAIDTAVFPGAQGGPHVNKIAALCAAFTIAGTDKFRELQKQIVRNAAALAKAFQEEGIKVAYGGTDTHIVMADTDVFGKKEKNSLYGEIAARILDIAGIVVNKNTIPGDTRTALARGLRFGTPWITQLGLREDDMKDIASAVAGILKAIRPFTYTSVRGKLPRGKIALETLEKCRDDVNRIIGRIGTAGRGNAELQEDTAVPAQPASASRDAAGLKVSGFRAEAFLQGACTRNILSLKEGDSTEALFFDEQGRMIGSAVLSRRPQDDLGQEVFTLQTEPTQRDPLARWLTGLSTGYTIFDEKDIFRKIEGPVVISGWYEPVSSFPGHLTMEAGTSISQAAGKQPALFDMDKPFFIGQAHLPDETHRTNGGEPLQQWTWKEPEEELKRTLLYDRHKDLGGKMVPFAGYEMPVWYTSSLEEHNAVRTAAGLFDVSHMGCFEVSGPHAEAFLDSVMSNYAAFLLPGESCYGYLLDPQGACIDDLMVYRIEKNRFIVVVNASNEEKDWDWLNQVNQQKVIIDTGHTSARINAPAELRNLKSGSAGKDQLRGFALQGPLSRMVLDECISDLSSKQHLARLQKTHVAELEIDSIPVIAARTGYTGEDLGYELYVHPGHLVTIWDRILEAGKPFGLLPCGLGARDSLRTEAGLPLYGHELAGEEKITPAEAGFGGYVKYHKPFFIGRDKLLEKDTSRTRTLIRWGMMQKGVRKPNTGDPVADRNGRIIGKVTSCSQDSAGRLVGLALVESREYEPGTRVLVFALPARELQEKPKTEVVPGDRVLVPSEAEVLPRFQEN